MKNQKNTPTPKNWLRVWRALQEFEQVCKQSGVDLPYEKVATLLLRQPQKENVFYPHILSRNSFKSEFQEACKHLFNASTRKI